jgi:hypothetical protein
VFLCGAAFGFPGSPRHQCSNPPLSDTCLPGCMYCCMHRAPDAAAGNTRIGDTTDELQRQKALFKDSHGLLGTLKRQALLDRCRRC